MRKHTHSYVGNIRAEMARRGLPQIALAQVLGISQAAVSRRLNGETEFSVRELLEVADLLGVDAAVLMAPAAA